MTPAFLFSVIFSCPVFAEEDEENDKPSWQEKREEWKERQEERKENHEERKENMEERKEEMQEKREEMRERRAERFANFIAKVKEKINNVIERLEEAGVDTSTVEANLGTFSSYADSVLSARTELDTAIENEGDVEAARAAVKEAHEAFRGYYRNTLRPSIEEAVEEARNNK